MSRRAADPSGSTPALAMRSHLTRRVFRRLIADQPVVRHCHSCALTRPIPATRRRNAAVPAKPITPARTFLGMFTRRRREDNTDKDEPGMAKMLELERRIHLIARLTPALELVEAVQSFAEHKINSKVPIEDYQAERLLQTIRTLEEDEYSIAEQKILTDEMGGGSPLTFSILNSVLIAIGRKSRQGFTQVHNELARVVWKAMLSRDRQAIDFVPYDYIRILCSTGDTATAKRAVEEREAFNTQARAWCMILAGHSREGDEMALAETLERMQQLGLTSDPHVKRVMAVHYATIDDISEAKRWFTPDVLIKQGRSRGRNKTSNTFAAVSNSDLLPSLADVFRQLFQFCLRNGELEWGKQLVESLSEKDGGRSNDENWEAIFVASAAEGKSVEEIDRMFTVMTTASTHTAQPSPYPSVNTLNGLIRYAALKDDAYTAERYFGLARKWNVSPNAETYILQIEYRLGAGDIDGALASYALLREEDITEDADWDVMNKLLLALLARPNTSNDLIMGLTEDLSVRRRTYESETVMALCVYHLDRDEYAEVVDLLEMYAHRYSMSERLRILEVLSSFALRQTDDEVGRAWDTYMIFQQIFDFETRRDLRNRMMQFLFDRHRPDLATHVFTSMNQHMRADTRPDASTYILAFEGVAKTGDYDALEVVHNLLKLDTDVEPNTRIHNGLMLAYTACSMELRALQFWGDVSTSDEGPSYESLRIALRACERVPWGHRTARQIWTKLRQADVEVTRDLFASYVACLSGQSLIDELRAELPKMREVTGGDVDLFTLATVYNAAYGVTQQLALEQWFSEQYPDLWREILERGRDENELGIQTIRGIDRSLRT